MEPIDAFSKLKFESEFQALSPGGAISYVEVPNMMNNIDAVLSVMQYIYDNIMCTEITRGMTFTGTFLGIFTEKATASFTKWRTVFDRE